MAKNYISRGDVLTLTAQAAHTSGSPYRISGFNGVALISVESGEQLSFQLSGIFEFTMSDAAEVGSRIFIDLNEGLHATGGGPQPIGQDWILFGRAVTASDAEGKFYCRLLQSD